MKKVGKQMKKRKKALSFSAAVLLGATLTATSMSNIVFAENTFSFNQYGRYVISFRKYGKGYRCRFYKIRN